MTERSNPFVGPRTFSESDRDVYFGREPEAAGLLSLVLSQRLVLFYAQSGAGKSSLINARLIPRLRQEGFDVLAIGRVGGAAAHGQDPITNVFAFNLVTSLAAEGEADELASLTLSEFLQMKSSNKLDSESARVLIIDQFEEIVTTNLARWQEREPFFEQLRQALKENPMLWVVLVMREDHVAAIDPYARLLPGKLRVRFHMQRMKTTAAMEAIRTPARVGGRPFAPGVAERLVDNLRRIKGSEGAGPRLGEFVEPVQLQVVCFQMWQSLRTRPGAPISFDDLDELGQVDAALGNYYDAAVEDVAAETGISELEIRNWFEKELITEARTRGAVYQGNVTTAGLANLVVGMFASRYLLRAAIRAGGTWYELVHDRFIDPVLQSNIEWNFKQNALVQAAISWDKSDRDPMYLFTGRHLSDALAGLDFEQQESLVREFIEACNEENLSIERVTKLRVRLSETQQAFDNAQTQLTRDQKRQKWLVRVLIAASILGYCVLLPFFATSGLLLYPELFVTETPPPSITSGASIEGTYTDEPEYLETTILKLTEQNATLSAQAEINDALELTVQALNDVVQVQEATIEEQATRMLSLDEQCGWLDLPFPYSGIEPVFGGSAETFRSIMQRSRYGGRINAFFDHQYPGGNVEPTVVTATLVLFDGSQSVDFRDYNADEQSPLVRPDPQVDWFSGHRGYDFAPAPSRQETTPVLAPADGTLFQATINPDGSHVIWLLHERTDGAYVTIYHQLAPDEHFSRMVAMDPGTPVDAGDRIATMGTTGLSSGIHLHFEVRFDADGNGDFSVFEVVDPFGFIPSEAFPVDPLSMAWVDAVGDMHEGIQSKYLWIHQLLPGNCPNPLEFSLPVPLAQTPLPRLSTEPEIMPTASPDATGEASP